MALGNANTSAQARGKAKPVMVKRRKEVMQGKSYTALSQATALTGESGGAGACALAGSIDFNKTYYVDSMSAGLPNVGAKVYTRPRVNDDFLLEEGIYLFKYEVGPGTSNYLFQINSSRTVQSRGACR